LGLSTDLTLDTSNGVRALAFTVREANTYLTNVSGVDLNVNFKILAIAVKKTSGVYGRPQIQNTYKNAEYSYTYRDTVAGNSGTTPGIHYAGSGKIAAGGFLKFTWAPATVVSEAPPQLLVDFTSAIAVKSTATAVLGTIDSTGEAGVTNTTPYSYPPYTTLTWATAASSSDQIGLSRTATLLPAGVTYSGSVLSNVSNTDIKAIYIATFLGGSSFTNYGYNSNASGDSGGVSSGRLQAFIPFSVGGTITFTGPGTNNLVQGMISFATNTLSYRDMIV